MVTDQADDITKTLKAAAQGKLVPKRRPVARKISGNFIRTMTLLSNLPTDAHLVQLTLRLILLPVPPGPQN